VKLYFVRHGESEANVLNMFSNRDLEHELTERGRTQAASLAQKLAGRQGIRLYTSPIRRAAQTAEILAAALGIPYQVTGALREYDCGILEGRSDPTSWQIYRAAFRKWTEQGHWEQRIEGGESFAEMRDRFVPFLQEIIAQHEDSPGSLVLVGHGGLYQCMLPLVLVNVGPGIVHRHPIGTTGVVVAEPAQEGLVCLEWCGRAMDG
jgi:probable phosphoglycerate mutase